MKITHKWGMLMRKNRIKKYPISPQSLWKGPIILILIVVFGLSSLNSFYYDHPAGPEQTDDLGLLNAPNAAIAVDATDGVPQDIPIQTHTPTHSHTKSLPHSHTPTLTHSQSVGSRQGGEIWHMVEEINYTMDIGKGSDGYIKISSRAPVDYRLSPKPELEPAEFLSTKAVSAIDQAPDWLHDNLTDKFTDLAQIRLDLGDDANLGFGDLDGDGDLDMVCGSQENTLRYFENVGTPFQPLFLEDESVIKSEPDENECNSADPEFGDIDSDGDLDIIFGNQNGDLTIYHNLGDKNNPDFNAAHVYIGILNGYSSPCVGDIDFDGNLDIVSGAEDGRIYIFRNTGDNESYSWLALPSKIELIDVGSRSKPSLADLDSDGDLDLTIGDDQAIVNYYRNTGSPEDHTWILDGTMYLGLPVVAQTSPELADLNGDGRLDLTVGCTNGFFYTFENIGTGTEPQWQVYSSYQVWPGIEYYDTISYLKHIEYDLLDEFAALILDAPPKLKDEIAFSIAHTSTQVLQNPDSTPALYNRNAELIYEIDNYLDYANIKDHGTYDGRDYYSTVEYNYKSDNESTILTTELPPEIYYWYVVHPKITDEIPAYINPETGSVTTPPGGMFWREYLFYHNDTEYPPDPPTDPDEDGVPNFHYPKNGSPPLLKEKLSGIKYVYDSEAYNAPRGYDNMGYNNTRPWGYKDHAIETVSNWVAKTLPLNEQESADGERPVQPVRIAHTHNGNCGELQDLTIAAARTALIPAAGVLLLAEDHVWSEFYDRGWHQWDNYWSDGGSVVDNFMNYWVGWGQRGGSGLTKWHGDDSVSDVTRSYVPEDDLSTITIHVIDRNGYPVDGARVMVGSHWLTDRMSGYQASLPFPSIWNYTDTNGSCTFQVATQEGMAEGNKNFSFKVISKLGNDEQGKTELVHGEDYEFWFMLDGQKPEQEISHRGGGVEEPIYKFMIMVEFQERSAHQQPPNPMVGNYHPQQVTLGNKVHFYLMNQSNFEYYSQSNYKSDEPVECAPIREPDPDDGYYGYLLPDHSDWYLVGYNKNTIETSKKVDIKVYLYEVYDELPFVSFTEPEMGQVFKVGDIINISGEATDDQGISKLTLTIDDEKIDITENLVDGNWSYAWDTDGYAEGNYSFLIFAEDTRGNGVGIYRKIILEPAPPPPPPDITPPTLDILTPRNGTEYIIGEYVVFSGTADDDTAISDLTFTINSKKIDILSLLNNSAWSYQWYSDNLEEDEYKFTITGIDLAGNINRIYGHIYLMNEYFDVDPPVLAFTNPEVGEKFGAGDLITFEGTVEDDVGVAALEFSVDYGPWDDITDSISDYDNTWIYIWDTAEAGSDVLAGDHIVLVRAFDDAGNSEEESKIISLTDTVKPTIRITAPSSGTTFKPGDTMELEGECDDDTGVDMIILSITNTDDESYPPDTEIIKQGLRPGGNGLTWDYTWSVPYDLEPGEYIISAIALDYSGNIEFDLVTVVIKEEKSDAEKNEGFLGMPGFEGYILVFGLISVIFTLRYGGKMLRK